MQEIGGDVESHKANKNNCRQGLGTTAGRMERRDQETRGNNRSCHAE